MSCYHYKDREPAETIEILKNFFESKGFQIVENRIISEAKTFSCIIKLFINNIEVMSQNGKGLTEELSLASGYAELYERFCNMTNFLPCRILTNSIIYSNKIKNGYYFCPDEKLISFEDTFNIPLWPDIIKGYEKEFKSLFDSRFDHIYIGVPYKGLNTKDVKYFEPRILSALKRSSGLAAGNTLEEALVQALSEICEHTVAKDLFSKDFKSFKYINLYSIKNKTLIEKINKILSLGYNFNIIDMSFDYQMPVLMSLIRNKLTGISFINIASHPIFDIAVERTITESYLGIDNFNNNYKLLLQILERQNIPGENINTTISSWSKPIVPEQIILKREDINTYNHKIFLDAADYDNEYLFKYLINIFNNKNINIYYRDVSQLENLFAVDVFADGIDFRLNYNEFIKDDTTIKIILKYLKSVDRLFNFILSKGELRLKEEDYLQILTDYYNLPEYVKMYTANIFRSSSNLLSLYRIKDNGKKLKILISIIDSLKNKDIDNFINSLKLYAISDNLSNEYKKYITLLEYKLSGLYTDEEIIKLFDGMFNENTFNHITESSYILNKIIVEPLFNEYNSNRYQKIVDSICNKFNGRKLNG